MEVEDGSANMEVEDDDARLRAEVLAYMKANRVTRVYLGASTEVDLRETVVPGAALAQGHLQRQQRRGTRHSLAACPVLPPSAPDREQRLLCV